MDYPKESNLGHLGLSDDDLERGFSDAMSPDGRTRNNNDGLRSAYEDSLPNEEDDQISWYEGPARDDWDDAVGMLDRPGLNQRTLIRRN